MPDDTHDNITREHMTQCLRQINQRPVAYYPAYAKLMGSVSGGVFLSQILYWWSTSGREFFKTDAELMQETSLTAHEIRAAKHKVKQLGCVVIKAKGSPPLTHYTVDAEKFFALLKTLPPAPEVNLVNSTKSICRKSQNQACENHKIECVNFAKTYKEQASEIPEITTETTPERKEEGAVVENSTPCAVSDMPPAEMAPPASEKKPSKPKPAPTPWPEEDRAFADWLATQQILTLITPPTDFDWWCDMSYVINGLPSTEWLEREYAKMQMYLRENPRKLPTPRGTSRFCRGWLERTYNSDRRQTQRQTTKEVHIHYASNGRR